MESKGVRDYWGDDHEEELIPLFPIGEFTLSSECPHKGAIPKGSRLTCMVCGQSGFDHLPRVYLHEKKWRYHDIDPETAEIERTEEEDRAEELRRTRWLERIRKKRGYRDVGRPD